MGRFPGQLERGLSASDLGFFRTMGVSMVGLPQVGTVAVQGAVGDGLSMSTRLYVHEAVDRVNGSRPAGRNNRTPVKRPRPLHPDIFEAADTPFATVHPLEDPLESGAGLLCLDGPSYSSSSSVESTSVGSDAIPSQKPFRSWRRASWFPRSATPSSPSAKRSSSASSS